MKTPTQNALYLRARRVVAAGHALTFRDGSTLELEDAQYILSRKSSRKLREDVTPQALYMRAYRKRKAELQSIKQVDNT
jgi:hypothetical protein